MPKDLVRYQHCGSFHFLTFSCYQREPLLKTAAACDLFEREFEAVRIRDVDGGGHNPYTGYVFHHGDFGRAQDAPGSQAFHFLRDSGQTQMAAYNASMSRITNEANSAYSALQRGDQAGFANAMGGAGHDIQDSFAHTWRENGIGAITHLECYNCSGSEMDHQHPDYQPVATGGVLGPEAQASVDATADFLTLMNGASNMTQSQFQSGLQSFENKWFQQKLPH